jgi:AraC-like DNA-binding protein/tetratricopeptide (TPR) repeat protein
MHKLVLTISFLLVSLVSVAGDSVLDSLREQKQTPEWRHDMVEGDYHFVNRRYLDAASFYEKALTNEELSDSARLQLELLNRLTDCYDVLNDYEALATSIYRLREKAEKAGVKAYKAKADFVTGKRAHLHGDKAEGYELCLNAVEQMKQSDYYRKNNELRAFYADLLKMYARDGRYDEALRMSQLEEEATHLPSGSKKPGIDSRDRRRAYALRASLLAKMGRMDEANEAYEAWEKIRYSNPVDDHEIMDYLMASKHYEQALDVIMAYRDFVKEQGDTISYRMLSIYNQAALAYMEIGDYVNAAVNGQRVGAIADSLHQNVSRDEMAVTYALLEQQEDSNRRMMIVSASILAILILVLTTFIILYYTRKIHHRNKVLARALNGLDAYRRAVMNGQPLTSPEVVAALEDVRTYSGETDLADDKTEEPDDEDRRLFVEMDTQVTRDKLFLNPHFGRDELTRLIGVDKNRFGKMMSKYSDASNTSVYVNTKRVEYGAKLLLEHPEYTIATIATECGMSNTVTFNRTFKFIYGMTPSEYREKVKPLISTTE